MSLKLSFSCIVSTRYEDGSKLVAEGQEISGELFWKLQKQKGKIKALVKGYKTS